jgi:hypothetical protein
MFARFRAESPAADRVGSPPGYPVHMLMIIFSVTGHLLPIEHFYFLISGMKIRRKPGS